MSSRLTLLWCTLLWTCTNHEQRPLSGHIWKPPDGRAVDEWAEHHGMTLGMHNRILEDAREYKDKLAAEYDREVRDHQPSS